MLHDVEGRIESIHEGGATHMNDHVEFINPGSLMDRLPNKGSAQQTML